MPRRATAVSNDRCASCYVVDEGSRAPIESVAQPATKGGVRLEPEGQEERQHAPSLTLWPIGFAVGVVCVLVGLIVSWPAVAVGAVIAAVFGFLWIRDVTRDVRGAPEPAPGPAVPAHVPTAEEQQPEKYSRNAFLELSTLGIGAAIAGIVTLPVLGFMVLPAFVDQGRDDVDVGGVDDFPEGQYVVTTYMAAPEQGEVSRRTAFIRNNGTLDGLPSFTILSNSCVHLGCPVQPNGLLEEDAAQTERTESAGEVTRIPVDPSGFGCPCHGGQYDTEGNRTAGPPVRALDRFTYKIENGRLVLASPYSVSSVEGEGANATINKYELAGPGQHVDGVSSWMYPIQPPRE
jgi:Rieske Fe-S protein